MSATDEKEILKDAGDQMYSLSAEERASMEHEDLPLPDGWVRDYDLNQNHHYYVDTKANPPRSIWVHPWEDPQWQKEHPEEYQRSAVHLFHPPPPAYDLDHPEKMPQAGADPGASPVPWPDVQMPNPPAAVPSDREPVASTSRAPPQQKVKKSLFEKIFGTEEEREMARRARDIREAERAQQYVIQRERQMQDRLARQINRVDSRLSRQEGRLARRIDRQEARMDRREARLEARADRYILPGRFERREERFERHRDMVEQRLSLEQMRLAAQREMMMGRFGHAHGCYVSSGQYAPPPFAFTGRRRIGRYY